MSQHGIDRIVYNIFNQKNDGIFVEAGASNPYDQNNTSFLENCGWSGLLVEPITDYNEIYKTTRPKSILENYALVEKTYPHNTINFGHANSGLESGVTALHLRQYRSYQVPCCPLDTLLRKHNLTHVDFLTLDTEGYEHHVLLGIDFNYTKFNLILLEIHPYDESTLIKTDDFSYLNDHGYKQCKNIITEHEPNRYQIFAHKTFYSPALISL
jgi:FkbM family methyltransferase